MVAITVILAAVIGAFVLEIGDQQETAPNMSFDTDQRLLFYEDNAGDNANLTTVSITHAGGDVAMVENNRIKQNGNDSQWGFESRNGNDAQIQPNTAATLGSNDDVEFTSGQSWRIVGGGNNSVIGHKDVEAGTDYEWNVLGYEGAQLTVNSDCCDDDEGTNGFGAGNGIDTLDNADRVSVVWRANSGGKTQQLFKYRVQ
jgi:FlaG/FlaF family flagellin (archaellin)